MYSSSFASRVPHGRAVAGAEHVEVLALAQPRERAADSRPARRGSGLMKTLPSPSTASPVKHAPPATSAKWSGAWPGVETASKGPKRTPSRELHVDPAAPGRERRRVAREQRGGLGVVGVVVGQRDAAEPAALVDRGEHAREVLLERGPGSTTQAGSRPTTQVLVPDSVSGPGLGARRRTISCSASSAASERPRPTARSASSRH